MNNLTLSYGSPASAEADVEAATVDLNLSKSADLLDLELTLIESVTLNGTRTTFGRNLAVGLVLGSIVLGAVLGNILVVLSVCTNRRLRTVTNFYVVSLALSDLCVALLVMPIAIIVEITGVWNFGSVVCELWVSCDVLLCTASILNLCCISLDRYFAITKPLVYATKRSKRLALAMIAVVWVSAVVITCPPIFGWREANRQADSHCDLTKAPGYIIYSSLGSFYLPLFVMIFAYIRIFIVACRRERRFRPYYNQRSLRYTDSSSKNATTLGIHVTEGESIEMGDLNESLTSTDGGCGGAGTGGGLLGSCATSRAGLEIGGSGTGSGGGGGGAGVGGGVSGGGSAGVGGVTAGGGSLVVGHNKLKLSQQSNSRSRCAGGSKPGNVHANRNVFTNSHAHLSHCPSDASYSSATAVTGSGGGSSPNVGSSCGSAFGSASGFSRSASVSSKRCGTYAVASKTERGRERAVLLKEHKAAKTLAVVVGGFIACWLPFFLMYVIEPFCQSCQFNPTLARFFVWLGYFNSVMNPFIYAFYNKDFRHSFWTLTLGLICREK